MLRSSSLHAIRPAGVPTSRAAFSCTSRARSDATPPEKPTPPSAGRGRGRGSTDSFTFAGITLERIQAQRRDPPPRQAGAVQGAAGAGRGRGRGRGALNQPSQGRPGWRSSQQTSPQTGTSSGTRPRMAQDAFRQPSGRPALRSQGPSSFAARQDEQFADAPSERALPAEAARSRARSGTMYDSVDFSEISSLERLAGLGAAHGGGRPPRGLGRGNFRGANSPGAAGRGRGQLRPPSGQGANRGGAGGPARWKRGDNQFMFGNADEEAPTFKTPAPETVLDASGAYRLSATASSELSPKALWASDSKSQGDYTAEDAKVLDAAETLVARVPGFQKAVPLALPKGVEAPPAPSDAAAASTALTPLRWSDLVPASGEATREEVVGKAIEALAHHNPSMDPRQKAKTAALVGFVASTREERAALIRK